MVKKLGAVILGVLLGLVFCPAAWAQATDESQLPSEDFQLPGPGNCPVTAPGKGPATGARGAVGGRRLGYLEQMQQNEPQRYQRMIKIRDLSLEYRKTSDPARKQQIEKELRPLLDAELKKQQTEAKDRVSQMENRLDKIKKDLKQRDDHWSEVLDFNIKKITGQNDYLNFGLGHGPGSGTGAKPAPTSAPTK